MIRVEIARLVNRAKATHISQDKVDKLSYAVYQLYTESKGDVENFVHALEIADFMSRKTNHA